MPKDRDQPDVTKDGFLCRNTSNNWQLVLLQMFKLLIYSEFYVKIEHLGKERVWQANQKTFEYEILWQC